MNLRNKKQTQTKRPQLMREKKNNYIVDAMFFSTKVM